jgi:hypothetical protein
MRSNAVDSQPLHCDARLVADDSHLLTTLQMAQFVNDGYLRFDALVPEHINQAVLAELPAVRDNKYGAFMGLEPGASQPASGTPISECYSPESGLGQYVALPGIQGIVTSLTGPDPTFDHDFVHHLGPQHGHRQHLHMDAVADTAEPAFDIQLFYFPAVVEPDAGGTRFVPGSHLRRVRAESISRYQHILGEEFFAGPAGTVLVFHHGLWHAGQANPSANERWLHKVRLNPSCDQRRQWNTDDYDELVDHTDHTFATWRTDSVASVLRKPQPWQQGHDHRYDLVKRIKLWRYLADDPTFDVDWYLTRWERRA